MPQLYKRAAVLRLMARAPRLMAIGTSLGTALDYPGLMPSADRRDMVTRWAKHHDQLVEDGLISGAQRRQQIDALLRKHGS